MYANTVIRTSTAVTAFAGIRSRARRLQSSAARIAALF